MSAPLPEGAAHLLAADNACPGCEKIDQVRRTGSTPNTDAWTCTHCRMSWAISLVNRGQRPAYFEQLAATVGEVGRLHWLLGQVVTLADDAPTLTDAQLRDRLTALADGTRAIAAIPEVIPLGGLAI